MPFDKTDQEQETQVDDAVIEAGTAEISADLFPTESSESEGTDDLSEGEENSGEEKPSSGAVETPPQTDKTEGASEQEGEGADNSAEVQATGAPQTWTKEALQTWAEIPDRAKQEILKREEDMMRGIEGYKAAADMGGRVSKILEPYSPMLAAENIDPFQMLQSFAGNHYLLSRGTEQQKIQLAANLLTGYDIPIGPLLNHLADVMEGQPTVSPEVAELRKELNELKSGITAQQTTVQNAAIERISAEIDTFAADPAHQYFDELANDIHQLFKTGGANTLAEAYDKALWANPATRQKELDRLAAEKQASAETEAAKRTEKKAKSTADHVEVNPKSRGGTTPVGSVDDTLEETLAIIKSRG